MPITVGNSGALSSDNANISGALNNNGEDIVVGVSQRGTMALES